MKSILSLLIIFFISGSIIAQSNSSTKTNTSKDISKPLKANQTQSTKAPRVVKISEVKHNTKIRTVKSEELNPKKEKLQINNKNNNATKED